MKKILLFAIIALFSIASAEAQLEYFTAADGFAYAANSSQDEGISDPELLFVGTVMMTVPIPIIGDVSTDFSIEDGTSNIWLYMFREKNDPATIVAISLVKIPIIGFAAYSLDTEDLGDLPVDPTKPLPLTWADSDVFAGKLSEDDDFLTYYYSTLDPENWVIGLYVNTILDYLETDEPYWGIVIYEEDAQYACAMHATTEEFSCTGLITEVRDMQISEVKVFPNPASEMVNITLPQGEDASAYSVRIVDYLGREKK